MLPLLSACVLLSEGLPQTSLRPDGAVTVTTGPDLEALAHFSEGTLVVKVDSDCDTR